MGSKLARDPALAARAGLLVVLALVVVGAGCGGGGASAPREQVRRRIDALAPSANLGHRGTGPTRPGHDLPENSIASFRAAIAQGADGIELDVELTSDLQLVVMHDDTLDRTTNCTGCVSAHTFAEVRACRLLAGDGRVTEERPPTLAESYAAIPSDALVNVELKVYGSECLTPTTGASALAAIATAEVLDLGVASRTLFSSFDPEAAAAIREEGSGLYSALLLGVTESIAWPTGLALAVDLDLDALHPFFIIPAEGIGATLLEGLQSNVWTVNLARDMEIAIDAGATAIITDDPAVLVEVLAARGRP